MFLTGWFQIMEYQAKAYFESSNKFYDKMVEKLLPEYDILIAKYEGEIDVLIERQQEDKKEMIEKGYDSEEINSNLNGDYESSPEVIEYNELHTEKSNLTNTIHKSRILLDYAFMDGHLKRICNEGAHNVKSAMPLKDFKEKAVNDFHRYLKYLNMVVGVDTTKITEKPEWADMLHLIKLKNIIAHDLPIYDNTNIDNFIIHFKNEFNIGNDVDRVEISPELAKKFSETAETILLSVLELTIKRFKV